MNYTLPVIIIIESILAAYFVNIIIGILIKYAEKTSTKLDDLILHAMRKPICILILVVGIYYALHNTPDIAEIIDRYDQDYKYRQAIIILAATWVISTFVKGLIKNYGHEWKENEYLEDSHLNLANIVVSYVVWIVGIIFAASAIGVELTPILTGIGVLGLVLTLATQTLMANIFGGILVTTDNLYKIGDRIELGGVHGDVIEIKARYTKIKTIENTVVTIPNSTVISGQIVNYSEPTNDVMIKIPVSCNYGAYLPRVKEIILTTAKSMSEVLKNPEPVVYLVEFGASSVNFELRIWVKHYDDRHRVKDLFYNTIYRIFEEENIEIPFNQLDVNVKSRS